MEANNDCPVESTASALSSAPSTGGTIAPSPSAAQPAAKATTARAKKAATAKASKPARSPGKKAGKHASHAERVEQALVELGDLLDEHEAELKEVKDRVQAALSRTATLRKAMKSAVKSAAVNSELENELTDLRKKLDSARSLLG